MKRDPLPPVPPPPFAWEGEAFGDPTDQIQHAARYRSEPGVQNGVASVRRYRISVELIEEPIEDIRNRIRKLWLQSDNMHDRDPLMLEARRYGLNLDMIPRGRDRIRKPPR